MCRRNITAGAVLIAFGVGVVLGGCIESALLALVLAGGAVCLGFLLTQPNCWHK